MSFLVSNLSTYNIYRNTKVSRIDTPNCIFYLLYCEHYEHLRVRHERTDDTIDAEGGGSIPGTGGAGRIRDRSEEYCVNWQRIAILFGL